MPRCTNARRPVHIEADVVTANYGRFPRMQPHPDSKGNVIWPRELGKRTLARRGGGRGLSGA